jgi:hypothetical protein
MNKTNSFLFSFLNDYLANVTEILSPIFKENNSAFISKQNG